ncbi:MAG: DUF1801 domain-containing protein [Chloroflexi bacterium]|nr:MAG: DUF1801 domain-containing protein [Chloroflexota bacterium]
MVASKAQTVEEYLQELPEDRRQVVAAVREVILKNLPPGYRETMRWGMISYEIPLEVYPNTYNKQPLSYLGLAAQKRHYALYLMNVYSNPELARWLKDAFASAGKKLDMGKSCLRFKRLDDLPLAVIGQIIAQTPPEALIAAYEASRKK